ncbi:MAG: polysaccharide biosynthesis C-terminal domain-containing protein [Candidatus Aenigmatarchaeota archaeon]
MSEYIRMIRQISFSYASLILTIIINPLLIFLLTRNLTVNDYGVYSLFAVTVSSLVVLLELGLSQFIITKLPGLPHQKKMSTFFSLMFFELIFLLAVAVIFITPPAQSFLSAIMKIENFSLGLQFLFVIIFISTLTRLYSAYFVANKKIELNSIILFIQQIILVAILSAVVGFGELTILRVVVIWLFSSVVAIVLYSLKSRDVFSVLKSWRIEMSVVVPALIFSMPVIFIFLGSLIIEMGNRYVLNYFTNPATVGIFSLGYSLINLIYVLGATVSNVLQPYIAEAWNRKGDHNLLFNIALKYNIVTILPFMAFMLSLGYQVVGMISGPAYADAAAIMPFLIPFPLFAAMVFLFYQNILLRGRTKIIPAIYITSAAINIALNILLISRFGMYGAAIATTVSYFIMFLMMYFYCKKHVSIDYRYLAVHKVLTAAVVSGLVMWLLNPQVLVEKIAVFALGFLVYAALLFVFKVFDKREIKIINRLRGKK